LFTILQLFFNMNYRFFILTVCCTIALLLGACKNEKSQKDYAELKASREALMQKLPNIDKVAALDLVQKSEDFAKNYPTDTLTPKVLFSAADLAHGIGAHGKSIKIWGDVHDNYPKFKLAGDALFLQASTFDSDLADTATARRYYNRFLAEYPNHGFANDAKTSLLFLGIPLEKRIELFEKRNLEKK
jgi:tetratricopeptide (TPR) repeat protein